MTAIVAEDLARIHRAVNAGDRLQEATVLVTGCGGFLGYLLVHYLVRFAGRLGLRRVVGLDTFLLGRPAWVDELAEDGRFEVSSFDIARDRIDEVPGATEVTHVVHAASIASPTFYRKYPLVTIDANVWGLRQLLDFYSRSTRLRGFLFLSSSEIYGDPPAEAIPTREDFRGFVASLGPRACYDEAKRFGETLCYVFATSEGLPLTIARPFNNYGPGMRLDDRRLPADLARAVIEGRDLVLFSDGTPTRTFCYAADAVAGYLLCLLHGRFDCFNIGADGPEITVRELAELYQSAGRELCGYRGDVRFESSADTDYLTDNPNRRCPSIDKARMVLGYAPEVPVDEGVRRYLRHLSLDGPA